LLGYALAELGTGDRTCAVALVVGVTLRHRQIARGGSPIACQPDQITCRSARVTFAGALQARVGGQLALTRGAPSDVPAGVVLGRVDPLREIAIAGGLIAIGGGLIAVGAGLISLTAGVVRVGERLLAVAKRLLTVGERLRVMKRTRSGRAVLVLSVDRPVGGLLGTIT
jgi:hypothetical protein